MNWRVYEMGVAAYSYGKSYNDDIFLKWIFDNDFIHSTDLWGHEYPCPRNWVLA